MARDTMKWYAQYPPGIPSSFEYPHHTMKHYFNESAKAYPDRVFIKLRDTEIPFKEANALARRLAQGLLRIGCNKQDRVAIISHNTPEFVLAIQACYKIGAIVVPINPLYTSRELEYTLADNKAETVLVARSFLDKVLGLATSGTIAARRFIVITDTAEEEVLPLSASTESVELFDYAQLLATSEEVEPDIPLAASDCAALLYTGGTTGVPKGCMLSNDNLEATVYGWSSWYTYPLTASEYPVILCPVPLYHVYGLVGNISLASFAGGTIVLLDNLSVSAVLEAIDRYAPNLLCIVPTMLIYLLSHPDIRDVSLESIRVVGVGGDALPESVKKKLEELSGIKAVVGYGLTETSGSVCGQPHAVEVKEGSVGLPLPDVEVRIMNLKDARVEMAPGELGEVAIRGPQVMTSYWNQPEETALVLREGWLYTGDIGLMDEEGWLFIKDRKKDLIIHSGFNVYPKEVDEVLYAHPGIQEACTIGVPDAKKGELVKSYIVLKPGVELSQEEIIAYCRTVLTGYKIPRIIEFIDALPKTAVGKPSRVALRRYSSLSTG